MILRRWIGIIILVLIIVVGISLYIWLKQKVSDVESDLTIVEKKDLKGRE